MKKFHTTTYDLYNKNNIKILVMSDIHFSNYIKNTKLEIIYNFVKNNSPNYILIPGDIIDQVENILEKSEEMRILDWITKLGTICKVLISLGNHDFIMKPNNKREYVENTEFLNKIDSIDNVYLLHNTFYEDNNIYVCGITQNVDYYGHEDVNILIEDLNKNKKILNYNENKLKILLIHSPINFEKEIIKEKVKNFDYIITGHMHNGCVPPIINEIWKSTRGIVTPNKTFFKKYERNTLDKKNNLLVNGSITTFSKLSGKFRYLNFLYPIYISILNFNNENSFKIIKKYHKYK